MSRGSRRRWLSLALAGLAVGAVAVLSPPFSVVHASAQPVVGAAAASLPTPSQQLKLDGEEQAFVELLNEYRLQNGISPLDVSPVLSSSARWMSEDMATIDYFSHTDSLDRDFLQRMADFGYNYNTWKGENLAAGSDTATYTFQLWRDSPGHNSNMLNPNFRVIGVARVYDPDTTYGWYWTTDFGGFDDSGSPPLTNTPTPTPTATPLPPTPTATLPPPTPTATPPPPTPTETPPPPVPTESPPPPSTPAPGADALVPPGANPGIAPPIRHNSDQLGGEPALTVRELVPGWNQVQGPSRSMPIAEALPVENGKLRAIYSWDGEEGRWRRYLPGISIAELNTLRELPVDQTVWVLASSRFQMAPPA